MAYDIGPKIGIEGEAAFRKAIQDINTSFKTLGTEMSVVTSAFDKNDKSSKSLTAQNGVLNKQIDTQKEKLVQLNSGLAQATAKYGETDKVTQGWQQSVNKATAELNSMNRELVQNNKDIAIQDNSWTKMGKSLDAIGKKMKTVGEGISDVGKKLSVGLTAPIVAAGTYAAKLASDFNESLNKVEVAFKGNAQEVKDWSNTTLKSFGLAKGTALDMASGYGDMATSMGLPTSSAAEMSKKLVGLAGDLASFKNIGISEANTALSSIFTGETESLKKLGIVMTQANLQEYAASQGIKTKIADMTQAEQTQLRYNYVMAKTVNAQGDFIRTGDGTANSARVLQESLKELGETIGQNILPVITPIIQKLSGMAQSFGKLNPETQKTILVVAGIVAVVGPLLVVVGSLTTAIGAITSAHIIHNIALATSAVAHGIASAAIGVATAAQWLWNAAMTANPIGLIIIAIAALIAIVILVATHWKQVSAVLISVWKTIVSAFDTSIKAIVGFFKMLWNFFVGIFKLYIGLWVGLFTGIIKIFAPIVQWFGQLFTALFVIAMKIISPIINIFIGVWNGIVSVFGAIGTWFGGIFQGVWDAIVFVFSAYIGFWVGLWNGIVGIFTPIISWFGGIFTSAWNGIKIAFSAVGGFFQGIFNTITGIFGNIGTAIGNAVSGAFKMVINGVLGVVEGFVNTIINGINTVTGFLTHISGVEIGVIQPLNIPKMSVGTRYLPQDMLIQAHKGEMIVPRSENPYANSGGGTMPQSSGDIIIPIYVDNKFVKTVKLTSEQISQAQRQRDPYKAGAMA